MMTTKNDDESATMGSEIDLDESSDDSSPVELDRPSRVGSIYSAQARQRIEYLQELRRLRTLVGDDAIDDF